MTSILNSFEGTRPQSTHGFHGSPAGSPHINRPASQTSLHAAPAAASYQPSQIDHSPSSHGPVPFSASFAATFKPFIPGNLSLPLPHQSFIAGNFPASAPPMPYYPGHSHPMIRTVSHAHPMNSATDHSASSRYSSSPHSTTHEAPSTAAAGGYPSFNLSQPDERHVNPAMLNNYSMSRSSSGGSDTFDLKQRLLTPTMEYRPGEHPHEVELRKVSDTLGRPPSSKYYPSTLSPHLEFHGHSFGDFGAHPQPGIGSMFNFTNRGWGNDFALSAERGKPEFVGQDTDYERERQHQIMNNKKLLEDVGLGNNGGFMRARTASSDNEGRDRQTTPLKRRIPSEGPVRASPRIASLHRNMSYADLEGGPVEEDPASEDEYHSSGEGEDQDEDEFRPTKRSKGGYKPQVVRKLSYAANNNNGNNSNNRTVRKTELSLWGLLQVYPEIPHLFPLFYYTLNNDLTINSDSVPLIGSIPSTVTALEKADTLRSFYHRGRRVLSQLDAFTTRCDRKYDGPEEKWSELEFHTRIAVRDVRRKIVERCENYKYTRRDILDKAVGKNKWQPIEQGMVEWRVGMAQNDPAGDLANVTLTLPTPPTSGYMQQHQAAYPSRQIKPLPNRRVSGLPPQPGTARIVSVNMGEPDHFGPSTAPMIGYHYTQQQEAPPPMYGEDDVPMTVMMGSIPSATQQQQVSPVGAPTPQSQSQSQQMMGGENSLAGAWEEKPVIKRSRSEDGASDSEREQPTLWSE